MHKTHSFAWLARCFLTNSIGTFARSGSSEAIALRDTSVKAGRESVRGSWRFCGALCCPYEWVMGSESSGTGREATWNMSGEGGVDVG